MNLDSYLRRSGTSSRQFAEMMDVTIDAVRKWRNGHRIPRRAMMLKINKATKGRVKPADWYK